MTDIAHRVANLQVIIDMEASEDGYDHVGILSLLIDTRHYCDARGLDFYALLDQSYLMYLEDKGEGAL